MRIIRSVLDSLRMAACLLSCQILPRVPSTHGRRGAGSRASRTPSLVRATSCRCVRDAVGSVGSAVAGATCCGSSYLAVLPGAEEARLGVGPGAHSLEILLAREVPPGVTLDRSFAGATKCLRPPPLYRPTRCGVFTRSWTLLLGSLTISLLRLACFYHCPTSCISSLCTEGEHRYAKGVK